MLVVYVDDFKLSGPKQNMKEGWDLIREVLDIEDPAPLDLYLGCYHEYFERTDPDGNVVRGRRYNQENFLRSCVERYLELGGNPKLTKVSTPFIEDPPQGSELPAGELQSSAAAILMEVLYVVSVPSIT